MRDQGQRVTKYSNYKGQARGDNSWVMSQQVRRTGHISGGSGLFGVGIGGWAVGHLMGGKLFRVGGGPFEAGGGPFEAGSGPFDGRCIIWGGRYAV